MDELMERMKTVNAAVEDVSTMLAELREQGHKWTPDEILAVKKSLAALHVDHRNIPVWGMRKQKDGSRSARVHYFGSTLEWDAPSPTFALH